VSGTWESARSAWMNTPCMCNRLQNKCETSVAVVLRTLLELTPTIRTSVRGALRKYNAGRRDVDQEVDDLTQCVYCHLLENDGKALDTWDPTRGPLEPFVASVARHVTVSMLRRKRRSPWTDEPMTHEILDALPRHDVSTERRMVALAELGTLVPRLLAGLDDHGRRLFELVFVEERPLTQIAALLGTTANAIAQWKMRFSERAGRLALDGAATPRGKRTPPS
jgi:RNA polymerase sigma factor (sigma-70 family)